MLQVYIPNISSVFFRRMLRVCLFGCCICFTHMLQSFYLDVAYVLQWFSGVFASVSNTCLKCFTCLQTYVASVASGCFKSKSNVASLSSLFCHLASVSLPRRRLGIHRPSPSFLMLVTLGLAQNPRGGTKRRGKRLTGVGVWTPCPFGRLGASYFDFLDTLFY